MLHEGLRLLPHDASLLLRTALALQAHGFDEQVADLVARGRKLEMSDALRTRFTDLEKSAAKDRAAP